MMVMVMMLLVLATMVIVMVDVVMVDMVLVSPLVVVWLTARAIFCRGRVIAASTGWLLVHYTSSTRKRNKERHQH